ncbi:MAG TPA: class F sortase [Pilimelia sp.]|nr:class F sortase [Pilimelia sp.]
MSPHPPRRLPGGQLTGQLATGAIIAVVVIAVALGAFAVKSGALGPARWEPGTATATSGSPTPNGGPPTRLRIPAIDVDTPLVTLGLDAKGALAAPEDYDRAGWYAKGTRPGDVGPAIIAGHIDSYQGPAVFFRLHELRAGTKIEVARSKGSVTFRVLTVRRYPKEQFPTEEVYGPTPNAQLRLITCGGAFDNTRRSYLDNVVVYAVAV